ncbi:MAG: gluconokinase [Gemmatimonadaceae bacterium]|nr:gluconokinase [Gemmatimonadaceae bacterium]
MSRVYARLFVIMGVSGSGKSLIGSDLARALGVEFVEGDDYHPPSNVERMSRGIPLTDEDRQGWLRALASRLGDARDAGTGMVVACSALKQSYRDILRTRARDVRFVYLMGSQALLAERLAERRGHFMPPSLLTSQFDTLEEPSPDEEAWVCDIREAPQDLIAALVARVARDARASHTSPVPPIPPLK